MKPRPFTLKLDDLLAQAEARPQLQALKALIAKQEKAVDLANKDYYPDVTVGVAYGFRETLDAPGEPETGRLFSAGTVMFNLPIWQGSKIKPRIREEHGQRKAAAKEAHSPPADQLAAAIKDRYAKLQRLAKQITLYDQGIIPQARQAAAASLAVLLRWAPWTLTGSIRTRSPSITPRCNCRNISRILKKTGPNWSGWWGPNCPGRPEGRNEPRTPWQSLVGPGGLRGPGGPDHRLCFRSPALGQSQGSEEGPVLGLPPEPQLHQRAPGKDPEGHELVPVYPTPPGAKPGGPAVAPTAAAPPRSQTKRQDHWRLPHASRKSSGTSPGKMPIWAWTWCRSMKKPRLPLRRPAAAPAPAAKKERKIKYWVAPMDPGYVRDKPGKAPCGMDLVPVYEEAGGGAAPGAIAVSPTTIQSMGVQDRQGGGPAPVP